MNKCLKNIENWINIIIVYFNNDFLTNLFL